MYLAIYICAIVLVASVIVTCFVLHSKSDQKRKDDFKAQREKEEIALLPKLELPQEEPKQLEESEPLEEFSLEEIDNDKKNKPVTVDHHVNNRQNLNEQKRRMNEKFIDYEKFLQEDIDDEEEDDEEEDNELEAIMNFDFDSIKGKSKDEILEITKDLPNRVRELILANALDEDDEEDED